MGTKKRKYITEEELAKKIISNEIPDGANLLTSYLLTIEDSIYSIIKNRNVSVNKRPRVFALIELLKITKQLEFDGTLFNYKNGIVILPKYLEKCYIENKKNYKKQIDKCILSKLRVKLSNELLENIVESCYVKLNENSSANLTLEEELNSTNRIVVKKGTNKLLTKIRKSLKDKTVLPISKNDFNKLKDKGLLSFRLHSSQGCVLCKNPSSVLYSVKTSTGIWYDVCHTCFRKNKFSLGNNKGQLLIPKEIKFNNESLFKFEEYRRDNVPR